MKKVFVDRPTCCEFVCNSSYLAVGSMRCNDVQLYTVQFLKKTNEFQNSKNPAVRLIGHNDGIYSIADDGKKYIASGSNDKSIIIWPREHLSSHNTYRVAKLIRHKSRVLSLCFTPSGHHLASGSNDGTVCIWNMTEFTLVDQITDHLRGVGAVSYAPNGEYFATGCNDGSVNLYDKNYKQITQLLSLDSRYPVKYLSFSSDSKYLAVSRQNCDNVTIFLTADYKQLQVIQGDEFGEWHKRREDVVGKFSHKGQLLSIVAHESLSTNRSSHDYVTMWSIVEDQFESVSNKEITDGFDNLAAISHNDCNFAALSHNSVLFWQLKFKSSAWIRLAYVLLCCKVAPYVALDIINCKTCHDEKKKFIFEQNWFHFEKIKLFEQVQQNLLKQNTTCKKLGK